MVILRVSVEHRGSGEKLHKYDSCAPYVHRRAVRDSYNYLRRAVESALYVIEMLLSDATGAAEVSDLHFRRGSRDEKDVLWFHITVNKSLRMDEIKGFEDLASNDLDLFHVNCFEAGRFRELVDIMAKHFHDNANLVSEHEIIHDSHDVHAVLWISLVQRAEDLDFMLSLNLDFWCVDQDFDGILCLCLVIEAPYNFSERASAKCRPDL